MCEARNKHAVTVTERIEMCDWTSLATEVLEQIAFCCEDREIAVLRCTCACFQTRLPEVIARRVAGEAAEAAEATPSNCAVVGRHYNIIRVVSGMSRLGPF